MNERLVRLQQRIERKEPVVGVFIDIADSVTSEIAGYCGCDFVWIDTEHGPLDRREVYHHVLAAQAAGCCAFVRVPGVEYYQIKHLLDMGPDGVIFPFVNTAEIAKKAIEASVYPIDGGKRGIGPLRAARYGVDEEGEYLTRAKDEVWKIFQIETLEAVDNLEQIAAVEGYHSLFVGPADLGMSMLDVPQAEKPAKIAEVQAKVAAAAAKYGKFAGSCADMTKASCSELMARGVHWMAVAQDAKIISTALMKGIGEIRN